MNKNLDGVFFRIKRDGEWQNVCFCDLTITEMYTVMKSRSWHWYKELFKILLQNNLRY